MTYRKDGKVTEKDVIKIRKLYGTGNYLQKEIGNKFGISFKMVSSIVNYKSWANVA